jgi:hypothetical protein
MKTIEVKYNADGYIESVTDNAVHFEQENDSLVINAEITTNKKVRAYIRAANNNSTVTDELTPADGVYSCVVDSDYMAKGTLYMGFELYDNSGYTERLEPLKIYIDSFINLGGGTSDNVYVVTLKVGSVQTLANGMPARVTNVGTKKDMILNFGLPRGDKGVKGDKGDKGDTGPQGEKGDAFKYSDFTAEQLEALKGPKGDKGDKGDTGAQGIQGIQGIQGVQGKDGYTPVKGVDYFTEADIKGIGSFLGIDEKADRETVLLIQENFIKFTNKTTNDISNLKTISSNNASAITQSRDYLENKKADKTDVQSIDFELNVLEKTVHQAEKDIFDLQNDKADKAQVENMYADLQFIIDDKIANIDIPTDDKLSTTSTNPVQNKVITAELNKKADSSLAFDDIYDVDGYDVSYTDGLYKAKNGFVIQSIASYSESGSYYGVDQYWYTEGGVYYRHLGDEGGWQNNWRKISVSQNELTNATKGFVTQTDLNSAIGDIETSLDNIIKKYGLGGDSV